MPSSFNACVFATKFSTLLVVLSVPSRPTAVVMPASIKFESMISGTLVLKPPSPPPPVICTCLSMKPGIAVKFEALITFTFGKFGSKFSAMQTILPLHINISFLPRNFGE